MAVDITERKDAEESLRRKEMELKEAQRLAGVGSWQWDPDTDTVVWSEELYRIAGRDPSLPAVSYEEHSQLYTRESWDRLRGAVETALHTGAPYELVLEMVRADGTHRWVDGTRRGPARFHRPHRGAPRHGPGHHGAQACRRSAVQREWPSHRGPGVRARQDRQRPARRHRSAPRVAGDGAGTGERTAAGFLGVEALSCLDALQKQTAEIIADVQALSHELHPPRLLHLGVVAAMRGFCEELSRQKDVEIDFRVRERSGQCPA